MLEVWGGAASAALVALAAFFGRVAFDWFEAERRRRGLASALAAELDTLKQAIDDALRRGFEAGAPPRATIYEAQIHALTGLPDRLLADLVAFHAEYAGLRAHVEARGVDRAAMAAFERAATRAVFARRRFDDEGASPIRLTAPKNAMAPAAAAA